jgi:hypothetical protein
MYTFDAPSVVTDAKAARGVSVHRLFWRRGASPLSIGSARHMKTCGSIMSKAL